ncbi:MFS transporter [Streptomyces sp. CB00455]|uniref:MFS transporter n=1 Tax=Streptomyces sp. CB00455 TaxID=1703927 RepID=UPI00094059EF|nr:MFS transporter [Streptomyces sp. CB00455]
MTTDAAPKAGRREWLGLAVLALPATLVSFDMFVLLLALPQLSADLGASSTQQLWIMDMYGFMVGGFLVTMGTLGDRIGRRKLLLIGAAVFGAASLLAAFSTSPEMLIAARALLGISGATLAPSTLALISNMFRDPKQMGMAIGIWAGCFSIGAIVGPIAGGAMLSTFWWGSVFLLGVPVMLVLLVVGGKVLPEYKAPQAGRLDLPSVALSLAAVLPFIYGLKEIARQGFSALPVAAVVVGLAIGVLFVRRQHALKDPLLDLSLFKNKSLSGALVSLLVFSMLGGASLLFLGQFFQLVTDLTPLQAGLALVPGLVVSIAGMSFAPVLARKIRPAYLIASGLLVSLSGYLLFFLVGADSGPAVLMTGFALASLGGGPLVALGTGLVVGSASPEKAGAAASLSQTSNEFGAGLGIAIVGTVGTAVYRDQISENLPAGLPSAAADTVREGLASALTEAAAISGPVGDSLASAAREAFVSGVNAVGATAMVLMALVAVTVLALLRQVPAFGAAQGGGEGPASAPADQQEAEQREADSPVTTATG